MSRGGLLSKAPGWCCQGPGDCLPPDAKVFVEDEPNPICAQDVVAGMRVLCLDNASQRPKYVEVASTEFLRDNAAWVTVALSDGTELTLTSNHPVLASRKDERKGTDVFHTHVPATELQCGVHHLSVLQIVDLPVASVTPSCNAVSSTRVALSFQQPERHEVFVVPSSAETWQSVAVGSANAGTQ
jgi:hypothetical protein